MSKRECTILILAAGKGTRMRSSKPKVLHRIAGLSLIGHVLKTAGEVSAGVNVVVISPQMKDVAQAVSDQDQTVTIAIQAEQRGTADAVKSGLAAIETPGEKVLVLYGDTPLIEAETLNSLIKRLDQGADLVILGFEAADPAGYGRLILDGGGNLAAIREDAETSPAERKISLCNSGVMAFKTDLLERCLKTIEADNAKGEYYLTDAVAAANAAGAAVVVATAPEIQVLGVNTQAQLAEAGHIMHDRLRARAMAAGVSLHDPETVYFAHDTIYGEDVSIEPHVIFKTGVEIGSNVEIKSFCHIDGARIADNAVIGPFARLRPGAEIGDQARIGNFVEIKQAVIEQGAKVNHLTYIGDARVGAGANIGAGTITCNYDGYAKHFTDIGKNAFIGSNTALVAPVKIGDGAYIGSGSVISRDIESGALGLTRAKFTVKRGWARAFRKAREQRREQNKKRG